MTQTFDAYAHYYDLVYGDKEYAREAEYVGALIHAQTQTAQRLLELGCGTGGHAEHLAKLGFSVLGIDRSEQMIERAEARRKALATELGTRLRFQRGDIRTLGSAQKSDAVISLFHVMSYQASNDDMDAALATAAANLTVGGLFVFDFWHGPGVLTEPPVVRVKRLSNERVSVVRIAEPVLHPNENVVDVSYTVFVTDRKTQACETITETHRMRYWFMPELRSMLKAHGLEVVRANAWLTDAALDLSSWTGVVVARKR